MMMILLSFFSWCSAFTIVSAFANHPITPFTTTTTTTATTTISADTIKIQQQRRHHQQQQRSHLISSTFRLRAGANNNNDNNENNNNNSNNNGNSISELTSTLARLDQQWKIQQKSSKTKSRWSKLVLPKQDSSFTSSSTSTTTEQRPESFIPQEGDKNDYVWILDPPSGQLSIPSCIIVFTGGAGLGQFPHIAYNELLSRISTRLNAVVIAAPYSIGLDHFGLAKQTGELLRRGLMHCIDDDEGSSSSGTNDPSRRYPSSIPVYTLAHSLGCKLQTIYMAATQQYFDGIGFMSFNNFSFAKTVSMARLFAEQIRKNSTGMGGSSSMWGNNNNNNEQILNNIFAFAENVIGAIGVDFTPNAKDTERLIQIKFDDILQSKTRLFVFDEDNLDNSDEFVDNCTGGRGPSTSGLPGGHLAPVYFKFGLDDLQMDNNNNGTGGGEIPPEVLEMAQEAMGGFRSASFGDEEALNALVTEICNWVLGRPPSRGPKWDSAARNEPPKLIGYSPSEK